MGGSLGGGGGAAPGGAAQWRYEPVNGAAIGIRSAPEVDAALAPGASLDPGDIFWVREECMGKDGVLFLRLADGRGWVFDQKPGVGVMCVRQRAVREALDEALARAQERVGGVAVRGRYHRLPRRLEDDYAPKRKVLGSGCNGDVLLAVSRHTGARVAVKRLELGGAREKERSALVNEMEILLSMDHPHVARLLDVYEAQDQLCLVMECMEGGELFDRVTGRGHYAEQDAAEATRQMLLAVRYLHRMGVAHRDLKLENFLYERRETSFLKLIDFGLGKFYERGAGMSECVGTVAYLAPEVLAKSYTSQCDLWSLGVIVYILLSGRMPFRGSSERQTLRDIRAGSFRTDGGVWASVSEACRDFARGLLCPVPALRPTAERALQHRWLAELAPAPGGCIQGIDWRVADALSSFARASQLRRACMRLAAWSLPQAEETYVREAFLKLDSSGDGVISVKHLGQLLEEAALPQDVCSMICWALAESDASAPGEIRYSDFLAAMMSSQVVAPGAGVLRDAFRRFDGAPGGGRGLVGRQSLERVLGTGGVGGSLDELPWNLHGCIAAADFVKYNCRAGVAVVAGEEPAQGRAAAQHSKGAEVDHAVLKWCRRGLKQQSGCLYPAWWRFVFLLPFLFTLAATSNPILLQ